MIMQTVSKLIRVDIDRKTFSYKRFLCRRQIASSLPERSQFRYCLSTIIGIIVMLAICITVPVVVVKNRNKAIAKTSKYSFSTLINFIGNYKNH
jgi:hypothetical protein